MTVGFSEKDNQKVYDSISEDFSRTRLDPWKDFIPLLKYIKEGDRVLDAGCGNGRLYQLLRGLAMEYIGADFSRGQLARARELFPDAVFKKADIRDLPFVDNKFDVVFCSAAFHHLLSLKERRRAMAEFFRVLRGGGRLIMLNWNLSSDWAKEKIARKKYRRLAEGNFSVPWIDSKSKKVHQRFYHGFSPEEIDGLLGKAGFSEIDSHYSLRGKKSKVKFADNLITIAVRPKEKSEKISAPSAGGVVLRKDGKKWLVAVEREAERPIGGKFWYLPKGHVEKGENLEQAARREIAEEVGIGDLKKIVYLGKKERWSLIGKEWKTIHYFLFLTSQKDFCPSSGNRKHESRWLDLFGAEKISGLREQNEILNKVRKMIEKPSQK